MVDVIEAFKSIFLIFKISGIFPFRLERNSDGRCIFSESVFGLIYTKFMFAVYVLTGVTIQLYNYHVNLKFYPELSSKLVLMASCSLMVMSNFTEFLLVIREKKALLSWLNKLNEMFSNVTESVLKSVKWHIGLSVTTTVIWIAVSYAAQMLLKRYVTIEEFLMSSRLQFFLMLLYYIIIWEIKIYLQLFLMFVILIRGYHEDIHKVFKSRFRKNHREFWLNYLRGLKKKNSEVKDLMDFLHAAFIPTISLMFLWTVCTVLFNMIVAAKTGVPAGLQAFWMVYLLSDTFLTAFACHVAESAAKKTAYLVHQRLIESDDRDLKREIEIFSLQLQHENFEFNALGFSRINNNMLYSMVGWLTSNTLILLQFQNDMKNAC